MKKIITTILSEIKNVMELIDEEELDNVVESLTKNKQIFVVGAGRSGFQAKGFAMRLMHIGYNSYVVGETITPSIQKDDIWIAISGSGETESIVSQTKKVKNIGCQIVTLTSDDNSSLAKLADENITVSGATKINTGVESIQLLSSLFDQTVHITLDVITQKLAERDSITSENASKKHTNLE